MDILNNEQVSENNQVQDNISNDPVWINDIPAKFRENVNNHDEIVSKLAKSYISLEQMNSKTFGKPDKYIVSEDIKADNEVINIVEKLAEKNNLSQDMFNKLLSNTVEIFEEKNKTYQQTLEQKQNELQEKIYKNKENIDNIKTFFKNINTSENTINKLNEILTNDFDFINVLNEIKDKVTDGTFSTQPKTNLNNNIITDEHRMNVKTKYVQYLHSNRYGRPNYEDAIIIKEYNKIFLQK